MGSKTSFKKLSVSHGTIGDVQTAPFESVKNIGATMDKHMKLEQQVCNTCEGAWYRFTESAKSVIHAFSKLDYMYTTMLF